jgi:hypothetical protein
MRDGHVLLSQFYLQALAHDVLASKCLLGSVLDPVDQGRFLLILSDSRISFCQGRLVRTGLGYQDVSVPRYQLLLLFHHHVGLLTTFFQVYLSDLIHCLLSTCILRAAQAAEVLLSFTGSYSFL